VTNRAFTLLELILVLAVLGVLASVVAARLSGLRSTQGVELAARQLSEQVLRARQLATQRAVPVRLRLDLATPAIAVQLLDNGTASDPGDGHDAQVTLRSGAEELSASFVRDDGIAASSTTVDLLFWPDARCDPAGTWHIASTGRQATVHIPSGPQPVTVSIDHAVTP
jgi:prepilin-type N-terminal cleavage/methylation domain-containing protein